jgi:hypothetical protein
MRMLMGVWKSKNGVYYVRKKVPAKLERSVPIVLGHPRPRMAWLKRSLRTKDIREANIKAKPVLMEYDRVLAKAAALLQEVPLVRDLSEPRIEQMAAYFYSWTLEEDEESRRDGTGSEEVFQDVAEQLRGLGIAFYTPFRTNGPKPSFGLSDREILKVREGTDEVLRNAKEALARGEVSFVSEQVSELLAIFRVNLDPSSAAYRKLGMAVLKRYVQALLQRFKELHGDLLIEAIGRHHVRQFREALQAIPVRRSGDLRSATLPDIVAWSSRRPDVQKIAPATVNKLLGGVQAVAVWGEGQWAGT